MKISSLNRLLMMNQETCGMDLLDRFVREILTHFWHGVRA